MQQNVQLKHQLGKAYCETAFKSTKWLMVHGLFSGINSLILEKTFTLDDRFSAVEDPLGTNRV